MSACRGKADTESVGAKVSDRVATGPEQVTPVIARQPSSCSLAAFWIPAAKSSAPATLEPGRQNPPAYVSPTSFAPGGASLASLAGLMSAWPDLRRRTKPILAAPYATTRGFRFSFSDGENGRDRD